MLTARRVSLLAGSLTHVLKQGSSNSRTFAEIVIRASVLAGVPLMFKLLNLCASVNVRLGLHVAEMLQLPRLFSCAKCTFPAFCGIIRLGRLWQRCSSCHDCFSYANRTPPCSVSCVNVRLGLLWLKGCSCHDCFLTRDTILPPFNTQRQ